MTILEVKNVVSGYGSMEVLHDISLDVGEKQIVSVLGPNGAGKTTLLRTIFGEVTPGKGKIIFKVRVRSFLKGRILPVFILSRSRVKGCAMCPRKIMSLTP